MGIKINQIAKETITKMKLKSPYAIPSNAAERGLKFQEIRQYLAGYTLDEQNSIISEIERIINEINEGFEKVNAEIDKINGDAIHSSVIISEEEPEYSTTFDSNSLWVEVLKD